MINTPFLTNYGKVIKEGKKSTKKKVMASDLLYTMKIVNIQTHYQPDIIKTVVKFLLNKITKILEKLHLEKPQDFKGFQKNI